MNKNQLIEVFEDTKAMRTFLFHSVVVQGTQNPELVLYYVDDDKIYRQSGVKISREDIDWLITQTYDFDKAVNNLNNKLSEELSTDLIMELLSSFKYMSEHDKKTVLQKIRTAKISKL